MLWRWENADYLVIGLEVGLRGFSYLLGYVELFERARFSDLQRFLGRAAWSPRTATAWTAAEYCQKGGCWASRGAERQQAERQQAAPLSAPAETPPGSCSSFLFVSFSSSLSQKIESGRGG